MSRLSSDNKDKDEIDNTTVADGDSIEPRKLWVIEWKKKFGKTLSEEKYNHAEALAIFNQKASSGIHVILYEVCRSPLDPSVVKKTPILNSLKARQRGEEESEIIRHEEDQAKVRAKKNKPSSIRYRIILLLAVIGMLVLAISLISALSNSGGIIINPHVIVAIDSAGSEYASLISWLNSDTIFDL